MSRLTAFEILLHEAMVWDDQNIPSRGREIDVPWVMFQELCADDRFVRQSMPADSDVYTGYAAGFKITSRRPSPNHGPMRLDVWRDVANMMADHGSTVMTTQQDGRISFSVKLPDGDWVTLENIRAEMAKFSSGGLI